MASTAISMGRGGPIKGRVLKTCEKHGSYPRPVFYGNSACYGWKVRIEGWAIGFVGPTADGSAVLPPGTGKA